MSAGPLSEAIKVLARAFNNMLRDEAMTSSGRVNLFGMLFGIIIVLASGAQDLLATALAGLRSLFHNVDAPTNTSTLWSLIAFASWTLICMTILLVDRRSRGK